MPRSLTDSYQGVIFSLDSDLPIRRTRFKKSFAEAKASAEELRLKHDDPTARLVVTVRRPGSTHWEVV